MAYCRWDLGLSEVQVGHINAGQFVRNQIQLVVDQLDLDLHVIELEEDLLAGLWWLRRTLPINFFKCQYISTVFRYYKDHPRTKIVSGTHDLVVSFTSSSEVKLLKIRMSASTASISN